MDRVASTRLDGSTSAILRNPEAARAVLVEAERLEVCMSLFDRILDRKVEPRKRVRICVECGMPVEEHKDWCAILRGQEELAQRGISVPSASKT